jgi:cytochrome P450
LGVIDGCRHAATWSRLPVAVQAAEWIARPWEFMDRAAARYGDTFTMKLVGEGPIVLVSHPDAVRQIFTAPPELVLAGEANRILQPVVGQNSVLLLDRDAHKEQRRLLMPAFRGNQLQSYMSTMTAIAEAEMAGWPRGVPVWLHPRMQALTLEVILHLVFGLERGQSMDRLRQALQRMLALTTHAVAQIFLLLVGPQKCGPRSLTDCWPRWIGCSTRRSPPADDKRTLIPVPTCYRCCWRPSTKTVKRFRADHATACRGLTASRF